MTKKQAIEFAAETGRNNALAAIDQGGIFDDYEDNLRDTLQEAFGDEYDAAIYYAAMDAFKAVKESTVD